MRNIPAPTIPLGPMVNTCASLPCMHTACTPCVPKTKPRHMPCTRRWSEVNSSSVDSLVHRTSMPLPTRGSAPHHQSSGELLSNESSFCCGPQDLSQAGGGGLTARSSMSDASGTQGAFPQAGVGAGAGALGQGPHPQRRSASSSQVTFQGCPHLSKCPSASGRTSAHKAVARSRSSHTGIASRASGGVAQHQHHARLSPRASASADPLGASSGASGHPSAPHGQGLYRMLSEGSQLQAQLLAMWQTASASESAPSRGAGAVGAGVAAGAGGGKALAAPTAPQPLLPLLHQAGEEQAAGSGAGGFLVQPHLVSMVAAPALAARHALMHQPLSRVDEVASGLCINSSGSDSGTLPSLLSSPVKLPPGAGEGPSGVGAAASGALAGGLQLPKMVVPPPAQPVLRPATPSPQKQQAEDGESHQSGRGWVRLQGVAWVVALGEWVVAKAGVGLPCLGLASLGAAASAMQLAPGSPIPALPAFHLTQPPSFCAPAWWPSHSQMTSLMGRRICSPSWSKRS